VLGCTKAERAPSSCSFFVSLRSALQKMAAEKALQEEMKYYSDAPSPKRLNV